MLNWREKMNKLRYSLLASIITIFTFVSYSYAQMGMMWQGSNGWGMNDSYCGMYNIGTIEIISGEVVSVDKFTPMKGMSHGVRIILKTEKETISVHLGPVWYVEKQDFKIEPKDKITVKGSVITFEGKKSIMASEVKKGDKILKLWGERGNPLWSGCCGWDN
jgi:hypothetical protein